MDAEIFRYALAKPSQFGIRWAPDPRAGLPALLRLTVNLAAVIPDTDGEVRARRGWSMLRNMLSYKSNTTSGVMRVVPERYSSQRARFVGAFPRAARKGWVGGV